jgi:ubiquinone/menaquinone biosynthesis C-methylase UbiE
VKPNLIQTKFGYWRFDPIPEVDYSTYYVDKPSCIAEQEEDKKWWYEMYDDRLRVFGMRSHNILDVGCGIGMFLSAAIQWGWWIAEGIDPNTTAIEYAKDHFRVEASTKDISELPSDKYTALHCSYVLEHVADPEKLLKECYRVLSDTGMICVCVPNDFNPLQMILKIKYGEYWIDYPWHINYFGFDSLMSLMQSVGFRIYKISTMFPMEIFAFIDNPTTMVGDKEAARYARQRRAKFDLSMTPQERDKLYGTLAGYGLGREVIVYAIK